MFCFILKNLFNVGNEKDSHSLRRTEGSTVMESMYISLSFVILLFFLFVVVKRMFCFYKANVFDERLLICFHCYFIFV